MIGKRYLVVLLFAFLGGCASMPTDYEQPYSEALTETQDTRLGVAVAKWVGEHDGQSGFYPLPDGLDALGARIALIDRAERSIDAQYFLVKRDLAGLVFAGKLVEAADRGVRVRILIDDLFTTAKDEGLALLNEHPNIELRLFNPVARGGFYWVNFLFDFKRANRRMHNKSLTVDNQATIVGGRNIAEEYFQLKSGEEFVDFDILAFGPVAAQISETFDRYWNHPLAIPIRAFDIKTGNLETRRGEFDEAMQTSGQTIVEQALNAPLVQDLLSGTATLYPAETEVITDDPDKLLNKVSDEFKVLVTRMAEVVAGADSVVLAITPYLIPGENGVEFWRNVVEQGTRVVIVTNSLASTNHSPVHAAYKRYRKPLIEAGVELYEARADAATGTDAAGESLDRMTLHTKAILLDHRYIFVGSLNLDPRAIDINTEMGVLIDSPELTAPVMQEFLADLPNYSYRVELDDKGKLRWRGMVDGIEVIETKEPLTSGWQRFKNWFEQLAPESQL